MRGHAQGVRTPEQILLASTSAALAALVEVEVCVHLDASGVAHPQWCGEGQRLSQEDAVAVAVYSAALSAPSGLGWGDDAPIRRRERASARLQVLGVRRWCEEGVIEWALRSSRELLVRAEAHVLADALEPGALRGEVGLQQTWLEAVCEAGNELTHQCLRAALAGEDTGEWLRLRRELERRLGEAVAPCALRELEQVAARLGAYRELAARYGHTEESAVPLLVRGGVASFTDSAEEVLVRAVGVVVCDSARRFVRLLPGGAQLPQELGLEAASAEVHHPEALEVAGGLLCEDAALSPAEAIALGRCCR